MQNDLATLAVAIMFGVVVALDHGVTQATWTYDTTTQYLDNGYVKVGLDITKGGAIAYLAAAMNPGEFGSNMVNNFDLGRQVQTSLYGGPFPYNPSYVGKIGGDQVNCPWNPNQAGDAFDNASPIDYISHSETTLYVRSWPENWALDDELNYYTQDCNRPAFDPNNTTKMESIVSLEPNNPLMINVHNRLTVKRNDPVYYGTIGSTDKSPLSTSRWGQGNACVYLNKGYDLLYTYNGGAPFSNGALAQMEYHAGTDYRASEGWSAFVDGTTGRGVGLVSPGNLYHGAYGDDSGSTGETGWAYRYLAAKSYEIMDNHITYDFDYKLVLGTVTDVRTAAYQIHQNEVSTGTHLPNYIFDKDHGRSHWTSVNDFYNRLPDDDYDYMTVFGGIHSDTQLLGPECCFSSFDVDTIYIRARYFSKGSDTGELYWASDNSPLYDQNNFDEDHAYSFNIINDGEWHTYALDMASLRWAGQSPGPWYGNVSRLRFDPVSSWDYLMDIQFITTNYGVASSYGAIALAPELYSVPEPSAIICLLSGALGLSAYLWKRNR